MRALTLHSHWAAAVCRLGKRLENRSNPPPRNLARDEWIAIHAGLKTSAPEWRVAEAARLTRLGLPTKADDFVGPEGAVVAVCRVEGWLEIGPGCGLRRWLWNDGERVARLWTRHPWRAAEQTHQVGRWWLGPCAWELVDLKVLAEPVPARGALGLWRLPEDAERAVRAQIGETT